MRGIAAGLLTSAALGTFVAFGAGFAALALGYLAPDVLLGSPLQDGAPTNAFALERTLDLATPASVTLTWSESESFGLAPSSSGVVTDLQSATEGCGKVVMRIDGEPVRLLCSQFPLWRDLTASSSGVDADVLWSLLEAGGFLNGDQTSIASRWRAIRAFEDDGGATRDGVISPSEFLWVGDSPVEFAWRVSLGDRVDDVSVIAETFPQLTRASLDASPASDFDWVFTPQGGVGDIPVSESSIDAFALGEVLSEEAIASTPTELGGIIRLAEPILTWSFPVEFLRQDEDGALCVLRVDATTGDATLVPVELVTTRLGGAFVISDLSPGDELANESRGPTC